MDLDPCSDPQANHYIKATKIYTADDDGLCRKHPWFGKVYANVPGGRRGNDSLAGLFLERAMEEHKNNTCSEILMLVKAATGYKWFKGAHAYPHVWFDNRLVFIPGQNKTQAAVAPNPHGNCMVYFGTRVKAFCSAFADLGDVPGYNAWCYKET